MITITQMATATIETVRELAEHYNSEMSITNTLSFTNIAFNIDLHHRVSVTVSIDDNRVTISCGIENATGRTVYEENHSLSRDNCHIQDFDVFMRAVIKRFNSDAISQYEQIRM